MGIGNCRTRTTRTTATGRRGRLRGCRRLPAQEPNGVFLFPRREELGTVSIPNPKKKNWDACPARATSPKPARAIRVIRAPFTSQRRKTNNAVAVAVALPVRCRAPAPGSGFRLQSTPFQHRKPAAAIPPLRASATADVAYGTRRRSASVPATESIAAPSWRSDASGVVQRAAFAAPADPRAISTSSTVDPAERVTAHRSKPDNEADSATD